MKTRSSIQVLVVATTFVASTAAATPAVPGNARAARARVTAGQDEDLGFPIGEKSRLHTNLDLGMVFDTNPDRFDAAPAEDYRLMVQPGLAIDVPGTTVNAGLGGRVAIHQYLGSSGQNSQTFVGGDMTLGAQIGGPESLVEFAIEDMLYRSPTFMEDPSTVAADERRLQSWANRGSARFTFRPGGRALEFDVGYLNSMRFYDDLPDGQQHGTFVEGRWRFLPRTHVMVGGDFSFFSVDDLAGSTSSWSSPYNVHAGLSGQVTRRLVAEASIGFGNTLTWQGNDFFGTAAAESRGDIIGTAGLSYAITPTTVAAFNYRRRLMPVILLGNYRSDMFSGRLSLAVTERLGFIFNGSYDLIAYGVGNRETQYAIAGAMAQYAFVEYLTGTLAYRFSRLGVTGGTGGNPFLERFVRHQVIAQVNLRY